MSKILAPICRVFSVLLVFLQFFTFANSQDLDVTVVIERSVEPRVVARVELLRQPESSSIEFLRSLGPEVDLTNRISGLRLTTMDGQTKPVSSPDLAIASAGVKRLEYSVSLKPRSSQFAAGHVSWADAGGAMLMLDDLLPQRAGKTARIRFQDHGNWQILSSEKAIAGNSFSVSNIETAVFFLSADLRERTLPGATGRIAISGEWLFTDDEAVRMASSILSEYEKQFGKLSREKILIRVAKFPMDAGLAQWEADTRGRTVTIHSSDMPFKNQSTQRLHEQLRHELFHLWFPNELDLTGRYDWFYEGFALYQSLKMGVAIGQLRFEDMLNTLSQAIAIDDQGPRVSLIVASEDRWKQGGARVYGRGLLTAFFTDVALMDASGGKRSSSTMLSQLLLRHRVPSTRMDGTRAALDVMGSYKELIPVVERHISGSASARGSAWITAAGMEFDGQNGTGNLRVLTKPTGRQAKLLDLLGRNAWRKLSKGS